MGSDYYLYDHFNRLIECTAFQAGASRRQTYAYDGFSNLTSITTWTNNSPSTRTTVTNASTNRLSAVGYDSSGAMTSWGTYTYERDPLEMIRALKGSGLNLRYAYTGDDERFLDFDVSTFLRVWRLRDLDGQVIREIRSGTGWVWQKDWIRREGQPLAAVDAVLGVSYLHPDHLGTTRDITDSGGTSQVKFHFYPYGELAAKTGLTTEVMQFTGHERDEHLLQGAFGTTDDLDYMHARYYNPMIGRFVRTDPIGGSVSNAQTWNRNSYVLGRPISLVDLYGTQPSFSDTITVIGSFIDDANQNLRDLQRDLRDYLTLLRLKGSERTGRSGGLAGGPTSDYDEFRLSFTERILSSIPSGFAQTTGDAVVGFGDTVSFGLTRFYRTEVGLENTIDEESGAYLTGEVAGVAHGLALGGLGAARAAGVQTRVALHEAHHTFGLLGRLRHLQINMWRTGVKGSGWALRIPLPWR